MSFKRQKRLMQEVLSHIDNYEWEDVFDTILSKIKNTPKDLKVHEHHLGHGNIIDMEGIYNHHSLDDGWQMRDDNSGEYRDTIYYSHDAERVLQLIAEGYAELDSIEQDASDASEKAAYYFRMRRNY